MSKGAGGCGIEDGEKQLGARFSMHSAHFLLMHFKAFKFFISMQM